MRDAERRGGGGLIERLARFLQKLLVAQTGDKSAFLLQTPLRGKRVDDRAPHRDLAMKVVGAIASVAPFLHSAGANSRNSR